MVTLKNGDVVKLKSGGPLMTVYSGNDEYVQATWFTRGKVEHMRETFAVEQLELVVKPK